MAINWYSTISMARVLESQYQLQFSGVLPICSGAVGVFYSPIGQGVLYIHNTAARIHITYTNISGNIVNNHDNFNERTNTLLYKNIPLTLYSKPLMLVVCER